MSYWSNHYPDCILEGAGPDGTNAVLLSCIVRQMISEGDFVSSFAEVMDMDGTPDRWWSNDANQAVIRVSPLGWFAVKGTRHLKKKLAALAECEGKTVDSTEGLEPGDVNVINYDGGVVKVKLEGRGWFLLVKDADPAAFEALIDG